MSDSRKFRGVLMTSTIVAGFAAAAPAFAQATVPVEATVQDEQIALEAATSDGETGGVIVVTGSRIARPNLEQSAPVSVIGAEEVAFQQPTSAEDLLRQLPGAAPSIGPQTNNGSDGSARVNLRGLGTNRNLVLLNERRLTPRGLDGVTDLNIIPLALIERVDIYTGGATTVYGADAIAGVVNFITRRDFAGVDITANYGLTERGDGASYRTDLTMGANFDDGKGNAVLGVSYTKTKPVLQGSRDISLVSRQSTKCTASQIANLGCNPAIHDVSSGFPQGSPTAAPASIFFPFVGRVDSTGTQFIVGELNDYNFQPLNLFQTPLERWSIFGQGRYEISPAIELFSEALYAKTTVELNLAPAGVFGSSVSVPLNSQFLTAQQRQLLCEQGLPAGTDCAAAIAAGTPLTVAVARRFTEAGPRVLLETTNFFHVTGGARGPLFSNLQWELFGSYGESSRVQKRTGWGLLSRVRSGVLGCPAGSASGCVPFNLFGPEGSITPEMLNFIDLPTFAFVDTQYAAAQMIVSGDLGFASPWGVEPIGVAAGIEYRRYAGSSGGDATSRIPGEVLGAGAAALPVEGEYDTREVFGEIIAPLIEDRPFFHNLTVEAGVRYSDYSTSGGNWTWKVGGNYSPIRDIKFRGVYSKAVRAPNIGELFQPQVVALTARAIDPCQGSLADIAARGANFQQLCLAQLALVGAPASLLGTISAPAASQIQSTQGGNPLLDPEKATTWTVGVVLQPAFIPGLAVTVDYWNIKVVDAVSSPTAADVIDGCFQPASIEAFCQVIFRNPLTGGLSGPADTTRGPVLTLSNLGKIAVSGVDWGANYRRDLGFARLNWSLNGTWNEKSQFQASPTSINRECNGFYSTSCGSPVPKWAWNMRTTLSRGGTDVSLLWRHISSTRVEPRSTATCPTGLAGQTVSCGPTNVVEAYQRIPAYNWFDLALQQHINDRMRMTFTVMNLLDKDPPDVGNTIAGPASNSGNTFPTVYDPLGRRYVVGVNLRF